MVNNIDMTAPSTYSTDALADFLRRRTVATLPELTQALGSPSQRTVFRKLKQLPYRTSYSHRGSFYALDECIQFDASGLWSCRGARFSRHGTLLATVEALADRAAAGSYVEELDELLGVGCGDALRRLVRKRKLARVKLGGRFLHCSPDTGRRAAQIVTRKLRRAGDLRPLRAPALSPPPERLRDALALFLGALDEQQRRLFAGLESLRYGYGGDSLIAAALGMDRGTVARGRRQLLSGDVLRGRARHPGGGRKSLELPMVSLRSPTPHA